MRVVVCLLVVAALLVESTGIARAQRAVPPSVFELRPSPSSQQAVTYGDTQSKVVQLLGPPTKTNRFYQEMDKVWATVLHYGPNELHFVAGKLQSAALHDGRWVVGKPGTPGFHVGSAFSRPASKTSSGAPLAFGTFEVENKPGKSRNFAYSASSFGNFKLPQGGVSDDGYEILFDAQGKVTHIFMD